jgi:hypothetical protein
MRNWIIIGLIMILGIGIVHATDVEPKWKYDFGGSTMSISITPDGNYTVAGVNEGMDNDYVYLFNNKGDLLWKRYVSGDVACYVSITPNGEYVVAGVNDFDFIK